MCNWITVLTPSCKNVHHKLEKIIKIKANFNVCIEKFVFSGIFPDLSFWRQKRMAKDIAMFLDLHSWHKGPIFLRMYSNLWSKVDVLIWLDLTNNLELHFTPFNVCCLLSANTTKWLKSLKQFVGKSRRIV